MPLEAARGTLRPNQPLRAAGSAASAHARPGLRNAVLITRPEPAAGATAARVASLGFAPIVAPVLRIAPIRASLPAAASVAAVLVTSGNAVDALPLAYHATRLHTVGDATAEHARTAGFLQVLSAAGDAEALADHVVRHTDPKDGPLLLACGHLQGNGLAEGLRRAGFRVARRVVYQAVPARDLGAAAGTALRTGEVRAALFFSAESARQFVRLVQRSGLDDTLADVDAISIGRPAAVALEALAWRDVRVAARPTQDEMLALLR